MVLIEGASKDDQGLAASYGFKYYITLLELVSMNPEISVLSILDFAGKPELIKSTKAGLLKRFGCKDEATMREKMQIHAVFLFCTTLKIYSFVQVVCDLVSTKDGRLLGPKRTANDP